MFNSAVSINIVVFSWGNIIVFLIVVNLILVIVIVTIIVTVDIIDSIRNIWLKVRSITIIKITTRIINPF